MVPISLDQFAWWAFLDSHPAPTSFVTPDRRYLFINKAYENWALVKRSDVIGRTVAEVLGKAAAIAIETYIQAALSGATIHYESNIPYQRLGARRMRVTLSAAKADGQVIGFFATLQDVTAEHETEAAIAAALEGIGDGYLAVNKDYAFTYVNSGAARFYGMPREQMVGRKIEDLFPGSLATESGQMLIEVMESRTPRRREMASAGAPGKRFLMDIVPTTTGGAGVVIQDTTSWPNYGPAREPLPQGLIVIRPVDSEA